MPRELVGMLHRERLRNDPLERMRQGWVVKVKSETSPKTIEQVYAERKRSEKESA